MEVDPLPPRRIYREIVVFLPLSDNSRPPMEIAEDLVDALSLVRAIYGVDVLTGNVELRLYYDPVVLDDARAYLGARGVVFEIEAL